jgi:hypothetical protein
MFLEDLGMVNTLTISVLSVERQGNRFGSCWRKKYGRDAEEKGLRGKCKYFEVYIGWKRLLL